MAIGPSRDWPFLHYKVEIRSTIQNLSVINCGANCGAPDGPLRSPCDGVVGSCSNVSGYYFCASTVKDESSLQPSCCAYAGIGYRGHDSDIQRGERSVAAGIAVSRVGANCFAPNLCASA